MRIQRLRSEEIYDALLDDEAFLNLPDRMVDAYGARSCVIHWRYLEGGIDLVTHNSYFSQEHLANYAANFTHTDLWSLEALRMDRNKVWNCSELVPEQVYERSEFYNGWIRQMGDDTFHCIGTVSQSRWGIGCIGLHRGKAQNSFEEESIGALDADIHHLRRMLTLRGRIAWGINRARRAESLLDAIGDALIAVTAEGRVAHANAAAESLLERSDGLHVRGGMLYAAAHSANARLKNAIAAATQRADPQACALSIPRTDGRDYNATLVPLKSESGTRQVLISIRDPEYADPTLGSRLRALYGLSGSEVEIALMLSNGLSPNEIADQRRVRLETIRSQLKSISSKLGCRRQSQIVAVVRDLLPLR